MSVGVPVLPIGTIGVRDPIQRAGRRHGSVPPSEPMPPTGGGRSSTPPGPRSAISSGLSGVGAVGVKLLTRIPYGARSIAAARTKLFTPPLWKAYAITPAEPDQPFDDEIATIEPRIPFSAMYRAACLVLRKLPSAATRTARSKNSVLSSSTPRPPRIAALLTTMSSRPHVSVT